VKVGKADISPSMSAFGRFMSAISLKAVVIEGAR